MSARWYLRQALSVCVTLILRLHLLLTSRALAQDVTCEVPSVEPLANTSVTCHFPEDVSQTNKGFSIVLYKGSRHEDEKDILECWWLEGKMGCAVSSGYKYNRMISNKLTLEIPQVSTEHIGSYACKLGNMDDNRIKPCELKIKLVGKTMCDVPSVELGSQTSLTCYFPEDLSKTKRDLTVYHYTNDGRTDHVVFVGWKGDRADCITVRGYESDCSLTNHLTLTIPRASKDEEGTYSCNIIGLGTVRSETCLFSLKKDAVTSSCSIPDVREQEPTTLTCSFSVDMNETRRDFTVVRLGGENNNGVGILVCTWRNDQLDCTTGAGYEFNNTVTDHLVIRVPRASRDYNGRYACHVIGSEIKGFDSCNFTATQVDSVSDIWYFICVSVSVTFVVIILVLVVVFILQKKRILPICTKKKSQESKPGKSLEGEPDSEMEDVTEVFLTLSSQETTPFLETGSQFSLDALKQETGVEVLYDKLRVKGRRKLFFYGTVPQVGHCLQIINEKVKTGKLTEGEPDSEMEDVKEVYLILSSQETTSLLETGSQIFLDSLKQETGVEVLYDNKQRVKGRRNISFRGTLPQVSDSLTIIKEKGQTGKLQEGDSDSEMEDVTEVILTLSSQESTPHLETGSQIFLDSLKQETGVEVLYDNKQRVKGRRNISFRGTLPQVSVSLKITKEAQTGKNPEGEPDSEMEDVKEVIVTLSPQETTSLLETGSQFSVDSLKQKTGVEVLYDNKPRVKGRKKLLFYGTGPQVWHCIQLINELYRDVKETSSPAQTS